MVEALATGTKLLVVQEIQEAEGAVELRFQERSHGRLNLREANSATYFRLASRSQERQHPVGVSFGEGDTITELLRADNDVPNQIWEEDSDRPRVHFQGHDGIFCLKRDHPEFTRIRALLGDALRQKARVWFIAQKPALVLLDVLPAGWAAALSETRDGTGSRATSQFVNRTRGVRSLVSDVLQTQPRPYSEDIIDEVCRAIESNRRWLAEYHRLCNELGVLVVNQWIGMWISRIVGRTGKGQVPARSGLIRSYSKLYP